MRKFSTELLQYAYLPYYEIAKLHCPDLDKETTIALMPFIQAPFNFLLFQHSDDMRLDDETILRWYPMPVRSNLVDFELAFNIDYNQSMKIMKCGLFYSTIAFKSETAVDLSNQFKYLFEQLFSSSSVYNKHYQSVDDVRLFFNHQLNGASIRDELDEDKAKTLLTNSILSNN